MHEPVLGQRKQMGMGSRMLNPKTSTALSQEVNDLQVLKGCHCIAPLACLAFILLPFFPFS